jgi:deoxyribodipyrimidine photo-lyase
MPNGKATDRPRQTAKKGDAPMPPAILWLRQDLRTTDHPALLASIAEGPVIPLYILDDESPETRAIGGAQRWWLHHSLAALDASLRKRGSRLVLRRGPVPEILESVAAEAGCTRVHATRCYEPWWRCCEETLDERLELRLHDGNYLAAPESITNAQGSRYRVFTPWYRALLERMPPALPHAAPDHVPPPDLWPASDRLADWGLTPTSPNWAATR